MADKETFLNQNCFFPYSLTSLYQVSDADLKYYQHAQTWTNAKCSFIIELRPIPRTEVNMPILNALYELADSTEYDPIAPTWCIVNHLLLTYAGVETTLGAIVAASGECAIWSYDPHDIGPMYFSTIGGGERLQQVCGYHIVGIRTDDPDQAFDFISTAIDQGCGVAVAGPEMGLCYGYESGGTRGERKIRGIGRWGPAFNGEYTWEQFSEHVGRFGNNEGFWFLEKTGEPASPEEILNMILVTVVDWQTDHPAKNWIKQESYGLPAFGQYLRDVADPETRVTIDHPYIYCHAILFQADGRYHLGQYLKEFAENFTAPVSVLLDEIGDLYIETHKQLKRFMDYNILESESKEGIAEAITWVQDAYCADKQILDKFAEIKKRF